MNKQDRKLYERMSQCAGCTGWGACVNQCGRDKRENKKITEESGSAVQGAVQTYRADEREDNA